MMAKMTFVLTVLCLCLSTVRADYLDEEVKHQGMRKIIRAMTNQTKADSLNLPSNATTIRENIVDTFSCEGRMYGYYADVDNECQVFHVCMPSRAPSGRNQTYRWSFICPQETVFNQEVLVCTREQDSINCTDSPMYYDMNMEFGKVENDTIDYDNDKPVENGSEDTDKPVNEVPKEIQPSRRKMRPNKRGQAQKMILANINKVKGRISNIYRNERIDINNNVDLKRSKKELKNKAIEIIDKINEDLTHIRMEHQEENAMKGMEDEMQRAKLEILEPIMITNNAEEVNAGWFDAEKMSVMGKKQGRSRIARKRKLLNGRGLLKFKADV